MKMLFVTGSARKVTKEINKFILENPNCNIQIGPQNVLKTIFGIKISTSCVAIEQQGE
jgi:hypothetical protein